MSINTEKQLAVLQPILDESDRYCRKYKKLVRKKEKFSCFICLDEFANYSMECSLCDYTYRCCVEHKEDLYIIAGWDACIFCKRKLMDDIMKKIIDKPHSLLKDDVYGFNQIIEHLRIIEK
jgi:hypothetical protein